jgi:hypothetical protein
MTEKGKTFQSRYVCLVNDIFQSLAELASCFCWFLFGLLFDPEDGGNVPPKRRATSELRCVTVFEFLVGDCMSCGSSLYDSLSSENRQSST